MDSVEVTAADREAAADIYLDQLGDEDGFAEKIRTGTNLPGTNAWEEAFARHRQQAEYTTKALALWSTWTGVDVETLRREAV